MKTDNEITPQAGAASLTQKEREALDEIYNYFKKETSYLLFVEELAAAGVQVVDLLDASRDLPAASVSFVLYHTQELLKLLKPFADLREENGYLRQ